MRITTLAALGIGAWGLYRATQHLGLPAGVTPVDGFSLRRYLGLWYEMARIDHRHERGLTDTTARYTLRPDGRVHVLNRGYDPRSGRWRQAIASAEPLAAADVAHLQVSFVWPIRASYAVFALDESYEHALVSGPSHDYLWLLARHPNIKATTRATLLEQARDAGFDTGRLMWVDQRRNLPGLSDGLPRQKTLR